MANSTFAMTRKNGSGVPPYKNKDEIAEYLKELNKDKVVRTEPFPVPPSSLTSHVPRS